MKNTPKVSVLTTIYNREAYLAECIESVQKQRFQDYEHILVDDGSTDQSVAIAQEYAAKDHRIKVHVNPINLGDYPNRNKAASLATGEYLKYVDADDMLGRWTLDNMVDAMALHPNAALGLVDYSRPAPHWPKQLSPEETFRHYYEGKTDVFKRSPLGAIIKRAAFETAGGFSGKRMVGDFEMWQVLSTTYPTVIIPHIVAFFRQHAEQETSTRIADPIWALRYTIVSLNQLKNENCPLKGAFHESQIQEVERKIGRSILSGIRRHGWQKGKEMMSEIGWTLTETVKAAFQK